MKKHLFLFLFFTFTLITFAQELANDTITRSATIKTAVTGTTNSWSSKSILHPLLGIWRWQL